MHGLLRGRGDAVVRFPGTAGHQFIATLMLFSLAAHSGLTARGEREEHRKLSPWRQITSQGGLDDTTSAETAAQRDGTRSDHRIAAKTTNGTPGAGQVGRISEARPLALPVLYPAPQHRRCVPSS